MILMLSDGDDATAHGVAAELGRRGVEVTRWDVGDFPRELTLTATMSGEQGWTARVHGRQQVVRLDELSTVYYRKPTGFRVSENLSSEHRRFAINEARQGFGGLLCSLPARWVSHPSRIADAEFKPLQLRIAKECGLRVPRTLLTNDADQVRAFARALDAPMIYKPLSAPSIRDGAGVKLIYASPVEIGDLDDEAIALTAHLFQEWISKKYDVRLTVVGREFFAVALHAGSAAAHVDWRADYAAVRYEPIDTPHDVKLMVRAYLRELGISFGAFDFAVTANDEWFYLECNPNGQWGWIERETGLPITSAMADLLTGDGYP